MVVNLRLKKWLKKSTVEKITIQWIALSSHRTNDPMWTK
jgi:hypothetical protein